jgi:hypothetical protein
MIGCGYTRLSTNLRELAELGYITQANHPLNKRLRVYRVQYTIADEATMKGIPDISPSGEVSNDDTSPDGEAASEDSSPTPTRSTNDFKLLSSVNIFRETEKISCRSNERYSPESALPMKRENLGGVLAVLERKIKANGLLSHELPMWLEYLDQATATADVEDPNFGRATRLYDEVSARLTQPA